MSNFRITEDIAPVFEKDLERIRNATSIALERMLVSEDPVEGTAALEVAARHAHTLKGLAAMVGATGLARWGHDLERLWEVAPTFLHSAREKAVPIAWTRTSPA